MSIAVYGYIRSEIDWAARYGGEEFLIFLSNTDGKGAYQVAERIRKELENNVIKYEGNKSELPSTLRSGGFLLH